jgi:hypothetical protein
MVRTGNFSSWRSRIRGVEYLLSCDIVRKSPVVLGYPIMVGSDRKTCRFNWMLEYDKARISHVEIASPRLSLNADSSINPWVGLAKTGA